MNIEGEIIKVDPRPYRRRSFVHFWNKRWNVEYWTDSGDHGFKPFWTRSCAVLWAAHYVCIFEYRVTNEDGSLVSVERSPGRYDIFWLNPDGPVVAEDVPAEDVDAFKLGYTIMHETSDA